MPTNVISNSITSNPSNSIVKVYYSTFTGLRGIAAFIISLVHSNPLEARRQPMSIGDFLREFID